ncbi:MAG: LLM class F420-dependent oxidoreductase [Proteobacteria bacterium]|nr:LLM class F420-dependent oxidoreductase [Pseudomonadota bacterium]MDA1357498.1 LLM class F420-dependent oxidoreductase [Pseudomonadota bacterium]
MRIGAVLPQTEIGADPGAVKAYAQAVEEMGFDHILTFDHVLGGNAATHDLKGPYKHTDSFHELFVLYGFLAGITQKIELASGIIILPQRQTALVAKQAAAIDILSEGRLRLGVGIGWNHVEYEALGMNFADRGKRSEEQIEVMRALWCSELVTFEGKWHKITDAGLNPLPPQQPIPIWLGGHAEAVMRRIARIGDGWFPIFQLDDAGKAELDKFRGYIEEAGRDPADVGIESFNVVAGTTPDKWAADAKAWKENGATHISANTMNAGFSSLDQHLDALRRFKDAASAA